MHWNTLSFSLGLKNMEIDIFIHDFECFTYSETPMFNKWLDIMLGHTLAKDRSLL